MELKHLRTGFSNLLWKSWWISSRGFDLRTVISSNDLAESSWSNCGMLSSPSSKSTDIFDGCSAPVFSFIRAQPSYSRKWSDTKMSESLTAEGFSCVQRRDRVSGIKCTVVSHLQLRNKCLTINSNLNKSVTGSMLKVLNRTNLYYSELSSLFSSSIYFVT